MPRFFRPTWAEIDLNALRANLRKLRARCGRSQLMFVVKANAYGHGAVECSRFAEKEKLAEWLGVSSVEEGVTLREAGVKLPVLVLGSLYPFESFLAAADHGLTPTVASLESAQRLVEAAKSLGRRVDCHIKVETGMGRIGVSPAAAVAVAQFLSGQPSVRLQGVYTHLSCADSDALFTRRQLKRFEEALDGLKKRGIKVPLVHAANSAGALRFPAARFDMVRPGLAAYGLYPGFAPVLSLKSKLVFIKTVPKGAPVSYGAQFRARRVSRIATLPVGYADGWFRANFKKGAAILVGGRRCPIAGRVTMDMTMADVTDAARPRVGEDAVLIGSQGRETVTALEVAERVGTIPYEVTTAISARVPRVYLQAPMRGMTIR
jgi:alanine racemase